MKCKNVSGIGKIPAVLCMLCILLVSFPDSLTVNAKGSAELTASAVTAERGDTVAVTFMLEGNPGIWGLKLKVGYDHSALTLTSVENGNIFEENDIVLPGSLAREQFVFVAAANNLEDIAENGVIVTLNFSVEKTAADQTYPITLEVTQAINLAGEEISVGAKDGSVTVAGPEISEDSEEEDSRTEVKTASTKTGDHSNPVMWAALILMTLSVGGTYCALRIRTGRQS